MATTYLESVLDGTLVLPLSDPNDVNFHRSVAGVYPKCYRRRQIPHFDILDGFGTLDADAYRKRS